MKPRSRRLTADRTIKALRTAQKQEDFQDSELPGFGVRVFASGRRSFFVRYGGRGQRRRFDLGAYPAVSLQAARSRAIVILGQVETGSDPQKDKEAERAAETFAELAEIYLRYARGPARSSSMEAEPHYPAPRKKSWREDKRKLEMDLLPMWGTRKIRDIGRKDIIELVENIAEGGGGGRRSPGTPAPVSANRVLALVSRLFSFAVDREFIDLNPAYRLRKPAKERSRERWLTEAEAARVWRALDGFQPFTAAAWRLILLTGQRPGEVTRLRWTDLDSDRTGTWWTIPAEYSKNGLSNRVPLSIRAVEIIETLRPWSGDGEWILRSRRDRKRLAWLSQSTARLNNATGLPHFTPHDLRRTTSTWLQMWGIAPHVIDALQNHKPRGVRSVYQRATFGLEIRTAVELLGERLSNLTAGDSASTPT